MLFDISKIIKEKNDVVVEIDSTDRDTINKLRKIFHNNGLRTFMLGFIPNYLENPNIESLKIIIDEQVKNGMKVIFLEFDFLNKPIHLENAKKIIKEIKEIASNLVVILPKSFANFTNHTEINFYESVTHILFKLEERYNEQIRFGSESQNGFDKFMEKLQGQTDKTIFKF